MHGLLGLKICSYRFSLIHSSDNSEICALLQWFHNHAREPVTQAMMGLQLGDIKAEFLPLGPAGEGVNGVVAKKMEKHTGQLLAIKELPIKTPWQRRVAGQEVKFMESLRHVSHEFATINVILIDFRSTPW